MNEKVLSIIISAQDRTSATVNKVAGNVEQASEQIKRGASLAMAATAALAAKVGIDAVNAAGNYQSSLSKLQQASSATKDQMDKLSATAQMLGKSNDLAGVSASDAAITMTELAKAGLSVKDTLDAAKGTMALAKAGNVQFAEAATIAASALNAFGMQGKDASKVADALAAGANASQADLSDLAAGLQQSATVAKQFKLSLNENITALSLFANNGIKGSDAGTSLKTMLIALANPSKAASEAMRSIGFSAYDSSGQFIGLEAMSKKLSKSLAGLTDEQKQTALATIFGTDAFRAASVLAENAGDSYAKMSKAVSKSGSAQDAARAQMGAYERSVESLKNTASDLSLRVGSYLLPTVTKITDFINRSAVPTFNLFQGTLSGQIPILSGLAVGMVAYGTVVGSISLATKSWAAAQALLNIAMSMNPIGLAIAATAGITAAYVLSTAQTDQNKAANDRLAQARRDLTLATDAARQAEDNLKNAQLNAEGASLNVERAQRSYTDALRQYGVNSLEAREAAFRLKQAQDDLASANDNVRQKTDAAREAQDRRNQAAATVRTVSAQVSQQVSSESDAWKTLSTRINEAADARSKGDFKSPVLNLTKNPLNRASGGTVNAGQPYFVGENPDGSLNKTSELFIPSTSGRIINSSTLQRAINGTNSSTGIVSNSRTFNMYGDVRLESADAVDRYFEKIDRRGELAAIGVGI